MGGSQASTRGAGSIALLGLLMVSVPAAAQTVAQLRTASPRAVVQAMQGAPQKQRAEIADIVVSRRTEMLPVLRETVRSGSREDKMLAASLIADMRDRDGVDALLAATTDGDVKVRRRAATALRILNDRRAATRLRQLIAGDADLGVLKTALAALGRLGQRQDVARIAPFMHHADYGVVVVAAGSLAMLGDERGLDVVVQATYSNDPGVQKSATYALGLFGAAAAGTRLQEIVDDPQGAWKGYALVALGERRLAGQSKAQQVQILDGLARGRSRTLAEWSVDRLTDLGGPEAAAALRKLLDKETPVAALAERRLKLLGAQP
jgi:HEAT repeat protein